MKRSTAFLLLMCMSFCLRAQQWLTDSLEVHAGAIGTVATKDYLPLWLLSNHFGTISDRKGDVSVHAGFSNLHVWQEHFYIRYGLDVYNNNQLGSTFIEQGYVKAGYKNWEIRGGRYEEIIGEVDPMLSSGSMGISGNALPIPKIGLAVTKYTSIPFTNGWLQFKGLLSHGWMGKDQFIRNAWLHEKNFYLRIGKRKLKLFGGIQHYAVWGGSRKDLPPITSSWQGFMDVLLVKTKDDGTVGNNDIQPNRPGDHRGIIEGGIDWENEQLALHLYHQTPFESGQGIDIRNIDRLLGITYTNKKTAGWLNKIAVEFIYTKQSNDFYLQRLRESYYNNGVYLTGWDYHERIIGTPLFIDRNRGQHYFTGMKPMNWDQPKDSLRGKGGNIINNRVVGGHIGVLYHLSERITGKTLITYTQNYGTYTNPALFTPMKRQWYTLEELHYLLPGKGMMLTASLAIDQGQLTNNAGFMLGMLWTWKR
ncbi:capsule assembly Wzi family protein [Chitinophaga polysaccharea]|uniref:capsule assembly Wzi family protein n=1 Tax=Chitinophaga TaxID=79328 RepID=UPI001455B4B4|nr:MULTISPECIES: capsule assembly Wzi family protein [Chitinophaga]NLR60540.1 capsule assembly Wzi family protein [Chitinophaga polysaccharea]NLU90509.1 capsule assembly Wzi family protein [Chitinophaga sp. Ak27]